MAVIDSPYDAIHYPGIAIQNTSPNHLALCSLWHHGPRPPLQHFRLVELGCGDAANLLPLAFYCPESVFIGIDNSAAELERARQGANCLGLGNIRFVLEDIRNLVTTDSAPCDYIVAHGLYSWVPQDTRNAILEFCRQNLTNSGLAYISYNAQPGWAIRRLAREALLRSRAIQEAATDEKAAKAIEVAGSLLEDLPSREYAFAVLIAEELERVRGSAPGYVFHEYLAEINEGFWIGDFAEKARRYDLDYVADAQFCRWEGHIPTELKAALVKRDLNPIEAEEAADLLGNRYFRASILCRNDAIRTSTIHNSIPDNACIAASLYARSDPFDLTEGVIERFIGKGLVDQNKPEVTLDASITKAAILLLASQWPKGQRLNKLYAQAAELLTTHGIEVQTNAQWQLPRELKTLFESGQIDLRLYEPNHDIDVQDYPRAHRLARFEAQHREMLTTPYHIPLHFEAKTLKLVTALDGSRSKALLGQMFGKELSNDTLGVLGRWGLLVP